MKSKKIQALINTIVAQSKREEIADIYGGLDRTIEDCIDTAALSGRDIILWLLQDYANKGFITWKYLEKLQTSNKEQSYYNWHGY